jgi:hypothetical protein
MTMEITPFEGVGTIRFGDSRQQVRNSINHRYESFRKDVGEDETDAFDEIGVHVYYDDQGRVEFIEAFSPASLTLHGLPLMGRPIGDVEDELRALGYSSRQTDVGLEYTDAGIALTAAEGIIEGVGVFRRGYYDS